MTERRSRRPIPENSFQPYTTTAERYARFARVEARGSSPLYQSLTLGVSKDPEVLALLERVEPPKRQPNLLLASVLYLGGLQPDYPSFRHFVLQHADEILELLVTRRTQTNEVRRCATLLPVLAQLPGPLALIEVGASAGLCLLLDRYGYHYGSHVLGDSMSPVQLDCEVRGPVPLPTTLPQVIWRRGIDLAPVDVHEAEAVHWLECCIWPDQPERLSRFRAAVQVARRDPPVLVQGDLIETIDAVACEAPPDATLVVFHSAVLTYLPAPRRRAFAVLMQQRPWHWISNEAPGVVETLVGPRSLPDPNCFLLGHGPEAVLAVTHPHGNWIQCL